MAFTLLTVLASLTVTAQDVSGQMFVISSNPAAVHVLTIDRDFPKIQTQIKIPENATNALAGPGGRFLYVIHDGLIRPDGSPHPAEASLTIVDTQEAKLVSTIPLGWNVQSCAFSLDRRYLLCFSLGRWEKSRAAKGIAAVTIVDTATSAVAATLRVSQLGQQVLINKDASRVFVLGGPGQWPAVKGDKPQKEPSIVATFGPPGAGLIAELKFPNLISSMALSRDGKWLYLLDSGLVPKLMGVGPGAIRSLAIPKNPGNGAIHVVDVSTGRLMKSHTVGTLPNWSADSSAGVAILSWSSRKERRVKLHVVKDTELILSADVGQKRGSIGRMPELGATYVLSNDAARLLRDDGTLSDRVLPLKAGSAASRERIPPGIDGYPGQLMELPGRNRAILQIVSEEGVPYRDVALLDFDENRVVQVVDTGRSGVRVGSLIGHIAADVAVGMAAGALGFGVPLWYVGLVPTFGVGPRIVGMTARSDGRFAYVLNSQTSDVTVIDSDSGAVVDKLAVGSARGLVLGPGGKYVLALTGDKLTSIDTEANAQRFEHSFAPESIKSIHLDEKLQRLLVLTEMRLFLLDEMGRVRNTLSGLNGAVTLVVPQ